MAIDFGRMARGIATGYLSAKIANTEANDRLKEDIIKQAGDNFYNNIFRLCSIRYVYLLFINFINYIFYIGYY